MVIGFVLVTGALFLAAGLVGVPFLSVEASRAPVVSIVAGALIAASILFYFAWQRGRLRKQGKTLLEVRMEAVEKAKEPSTLVKIARGSGRASGRATAGRRAAQGSGGVAARG